MARDVEMNKPQFPGAYRNVTFPLYMHYIMGQGNTGAVEHWKGPNTAWVVGSQG
jgi:hypothetical protein